MPRRNVVKLFIPDAYYHIYNRGVAKDPVFHDEDDYTVFLSLLKRYLGGKNTKNKQRHYYDDLARDVEVLSYCLLPNHFHLLLYQHTPHAMTRLLRRVMTSYSMYFNKKYSRVGPLFQGSYKASLIDNESYLWHISRYIHLNALDAGSTLEDYLYSSYRYYSGNNKASWLNTERILKLTDGSQAYKEFVKDYVGNKRALEDIKHQLANTPSS